MLRWKTLVDPLPITLPERVKGRKGAVKMDTIVDPGRAAAYRAAGHWREDKLDDHFRAAVAARPDSVAVVDRSGHTTYAEMQEEVARLAGSLRSLGIRRGDVVSVQLPNWREFVVAHLALERLGAVTNPMLTQYRKHDIHGMLDKLQSVAAVVPANYRDHDHLAMWADIQGARKDLQVLIGVTKGGEDPAGYGPRVHSYDALVGTGDPLWEPDEPIEGGDVTIIIFTSGTVASKGVMHTHNTTLYGLRSYAQEIGLDVDSVVWMPSPIAHGTGLQWGVRTAMYLGTKIVLQDRWSAESAAEVIEREGCTVTMGATPFVHDLRSLGRARAPAFRSLRYFVCAGAPIPREVTVGVREELGIEILRAYGMSEHFVSTICRPGDPESKRLDTDGRPFLDTEVAVFDESRQHALPVGEQGELAVRGPGVAVGYLHDAERTRDTWRENGWQFTDDLAIIDEDGFVRIVGRKKDLIIRGGLNISPAEIEALLLEHPDVREVGVVGMPHARLGESICAAIVPTAAPPTLEELISFLLDRGVTKLKLPERLVVRDTLPRNPSGKLMKDRLREDIADTDVPPTSPRRSDRSGGSKYGWTSDRQGRDRDRGWLDR